MADSPYKTLNDIRSAIIVDCKENSSNLTLVAQVDRWINEGHEAVTMRKKRDWLDTQRTLQVNASVEDTCMVTNGSPTVTFATTSTTFVSGVELQFYNKGYDEVYNVLSFVDNVVTLDSPYLGDSSTAVSGVVYQSSIILDDDIRFVYQAYHQHISQPLTDLGPQQMRSLQEANGPDEDYAKFMTLFGQDGEGARRMVIYPNPKVAYTIYIDVNTFVPQLENADDEPVIPMQYRQILYWYGVYKLYMYHRQFDLAAAPLNTFNQWLAKLDGEMRSEIEFPQITVKYPRRTSRRMYRLPFDSRYRD